MNTTGRRGFIFSFDLVIAFITMLLMVSLVLMHNSQSAERQESILSEFATMQKLAFLADSLVKNSNGQEPLLGSATFSPEKRRVESNKLDMQLLFAAKDVQGMGFSVSRVALRTIDDRELVVFEKETGSKNCFALDRFVLVEGRKGVVEVMACE